MASPQSVAAAKKISVIALLAIAGILMILYTEDIPAVCRGAPPEYHRMRRVGIGGRVAMIRSFPLETRIEVFVAERRCGRPATLSLDDIGSPESLEIAALADLLSNVTEPAEKAVVAELIARTSCAGNVPVERFPRILISMRESLIGLTDGPSAQKITAAASIVGSRCRSITSGDDPP